MHRYKTFTGSDCAIHSVIKPLTVHGCGIQEQGGEGGRQLFPVLHKSLLQQIRWRLTNSSLRHWMAGQIGYDLSDRRFVGCSLEPCLCREDLSVDGEPGLQHNNRNIKQTLQLGVSSSSAGRGSSESQRGLRVLAVFPLRIERACTKPRISHKSKAAGKGEGASDGKHSPEHHDGLGKGPCECSLFWGGDNPSISTGQSCQAGPRWNPRNPLTFFICPVEGTSIQWQLLPWAFDQELRRDMGHVWGKELSFGLSAKWVYYLLSLEVSRILERLTSLALQ